MQIHKGVIRSFNPADYRATVQIVGSLAVYLEGVPVNRLGAAEILAGRACAVLVYDPANPADAAVVAVYE